MQDIAAISCPSCLVGVESEEDGNELDLTFGECKSERCKTVIVFAFES